MPRRRGSRVSTSSEQSMSSDQSENLNITEELPDPGLPKPNSKDAKEKKRVSFNFPVEVITKDGKFTGMGTIDLMETSTHSGVASKTKKPKGDQKEIVHDLTQEDKKPESPKTKDPPKVQDSAKTLPAKVQEPPKNAVLPKTKQQPKKPAPLASSTAAAVDTIQLNLGATKKMSVKEAKEAKKREAEAMREVIKKSIEEEKRAKAEFEEFNKVFRPGECLKYVNIEIHPELASSWFIQPVLREAAALRVRVLQADDICDPRLLVWTRFVPPALGNEGGQIKLTPTKKQCDCAFYIITGEEVLLLIAENRVNQFLSLKQELIGGKLIIIIFGGAQMAQNLPPDDGTPRMNRNKFENAISDIQMELMVEKKIDMIVVDTAPKLGTLIAHYTKAIAEAPYKIAKRDIDEQAEFFMRGDNKHCVTVDKDGNGLSRLWEQMIAVLPMSSLEIARSLGAQYKSPRALSQELQSSGGIAKVAEIGVTRTNVPGAKTRRLGPEFARKLHTLLTTEDGNMVIE